MNALILAAVVAAAQAPAEPNVVHPLGEAELAIAAGRLDQARIMIANSVKAGVQGDRLDRLVAELAFKSGDCKAAQPLYEALLEIHPRQALLAERAAICAVRGGDWKRAEELVVLATASDNASWLAWNARGIVADHAGDWTAADHAYGRASALAPDRAEIANNRGWSFLIRGEWHQAHAHLTKAAELDPGSARIVNNLELARAAVAEDLPQRRKGESDEDWAARLNDAGLIAHLRGQDKKAIAAFARAIEARSQWFERAANNLAAIEGRK